MGLGNFILVMSLICGVSTLSVQYPKKKPIIRVDALAQVNINYQDNNETFSTSFQPNDVKDLKGTQNVHDPKHFIEFSYLKDVIRFTFYTENNETYLSINYTMDPQSHWPKKTSEETMSGEVTINLGVQKDSAMSYFCQLPRKVEINETIDSRSMSITFELSANRMQAFGLVNGQYGRAATCASDKNITLGSYVLQDDKNITCVNLTSRISTDLNYASSLKKKKIETAHIVFPQGKVLSSDCGNKDKITMSIAFYDEQFKLDFIFQRTTATNYHVYVSNITVNYTISDVFFPSALKNSIGSEYELKLNKSDKLFDITKGSYYKCMSNTSYLLGGESDAMTGTLYLKNFRYVAFSDGALDGKNYEQCLDDIKISSIVPIAVGAALGVLVIIVLIAYVIGRRRNRDNYEAL